MEAILEYLRDTYKISASDLDLPDDERSFFRGQLSMIDEFADLYLNGIPNTEEGGEK